MNQIYGIGSFQDIIITENIGPKVIEKLSGNTPKSALFFYEIFNDQLQYQILNLSDASKVFFQRAQIRAKRLGLDFNQFCQQIQYHPKINVFTIPVSNFVQKANAIMYWGAASHCLQAFSKKKEQQYLRIIEEEHKRGKRKKLTKEKIHDNILDRHRRETFAPITDQELEKIIQDDLSVLSYNGIIISNHYKDTPQFRKIMEGLGLKATNYIFVQPDRDILEYERCITIWQR